MTYITTTYYLHITYIGTTQYLQQVQNPMQPNFASHFADFRVSKNRKFSREFDAYIPIQQYRRRISSTNSLENLRTLTNFKTIEAVSFIAPEPYAVLKEQTFQQDLQQICVEVMQLYVVYMYIICRACLYLLFSYSNDYEMPVQLCS